MSPLSHNGGMRFNAHELKRFNAHVDVPEMLEAACERGAEEEEPQLDPARSPFILRSLPRSDTGLFAACEGWRAVAHREGS